MARLFVVNTELTFRSVHFARYLCECSCRLYAVRGKTYNGKRTIASKVTCIEDI